MFLSKNRLKQVFDNLKGRKIAVIGDAMLDRYLWGDAARISPEAPVPVVLLHKEEVRIGGAANVADNIAVLGAEPILISVVGKDPSCREFLTHARELGLNTESVILDKNRPTTEKIRIIARHQQVCRVDREVAKPISRSLLGAILDKFDSIAANIDAVVISDYGKGVVTPRLVGEVVDYCCNAGLFVAVDPKEHHWEYYAGVDLIKPNHQETARATGLPTDTEKSLEKAGWKLLEKTGAKAALITTGERGMSLFDKGKPVKHLPTMGRKVFDVTGAGDTVIAAATAAMAAGAILKEAAIIANHAAGVVVAEIGTAAANYDEIAASMARERSKS